MVKPLLNVRRTRIYVQGQRCDDPKPIRLSRSSPNPDLGPNGQLIESATCGVYDRVVHVEAKMMYLAAAALDVTERHIIFPD